MSIMNKYEHSEHDIETVLRGLRQREEEKERFHDEDDGDILI